MMLSLLCLPNTNNYKESIMKRYYMIFIFCLLFLITGCSTSINKTQSDDIMLDNLGDSVAINNDEPLSSVDNGGFLRSEPPRQLFFNGLAELSYFCSVVPDLDENQLTKYLDENNFTMNGLYTKEDVLLLVELLNNAYIPLPDKTEADNYFYLANLVVYPTDGVISLSYETKDNCLLIFSISYVDKNADVKIAEISDVAPDTIALIYTEKEDIVIYACKPEEIIDEKMNFLLDVNGYFVLVDAWRYDSVDSALTDIRNFSFSLIE